MRSGQRTTWIALVLATALAGIVAGQDEKAPEAQPGTPAAETDEGITRSELLKKLGSLGPLLQELDRLSEEVRDLRQQLAEARMDASNARAELEEMRQFLADHHEYGRDFQEYRAVKEAAGVDTRRRQMEENRAELEKKKAERERRRQEARAQREREKAEAERLSFYRDRGFSPIGLDVFLSRMSYNYDAVDAGGLATRLDWQPGFGHYLRFYPGGYGGVDFSEMTISGSVLNASDVTRNIGIAVTFFDDTGSQVGQETVQVSNARPDVPYPFTAEVTMASDRPFATCSQHVLYADPVEEP